jgi:hypothetical protein
LRRIASRQLDKQVLSLTHPDAEKQKQPGSVLTLAGTGTENRYELIAVV